MMRLAMAVTVLMCGCTHSKATPTGENTSGNAEAASAKLTAVAPGAYQKPGAPVRVESSVSDALVKLKVRFEGAGENVTVSVRGIDGLELISGKELLKNAQVKSGDVKEYDVRYISRPQEANLVVSVEGDFGGMRMARVSSVTVGKPDTTALPPGNDTVTTESGLKLKMMPVGK
jgi:hypothetical protein